MIKALDHFNATSQGGSAEGKSSPVCVWLHQDDVLAWRRRDTAHGNTVNIGTFVPDISKLLP